MNAVPDGDWTTIYMTGGGRIHVKGALSAIEDALNLTNQYQRFALFTRIVSWTHRVGTGNGPELVTAPVLVNPTNVNFMFATESVR